jgi:ATP-dependent exoDNAse (exonuclease V) beta subunit
VVALPDQKLRRVQEGWQPPMAERLQWQPQITPRERAIEVEYDWAGTSARRTGTVLHRLLEHVGRMGIERLSATERERLIRRIPILLASLGSRGAALEQASGVVRSAFEDTLASSTGQWILSGEHAAARCELAIAGMLDGELVNAVVDRTFIDTDGVRWIIDYKSGYHAGADLDAFIAREADRYRDQLHGYRRLFEQLEARPVRTALFLPRHSHLQIV